jgi:hypothetical protein
MHSIDHWLKASAMTAVLMAGAGVFHHYVIYLPDEARRAEARATAPQPGPDQCRESARLHFDINWASACMVVALRQEQRHAECLSEGRGESEQVRARCDKLHVERDGSSDCTLPDARAAVVNAAFKDEDDRCVAEAKRRVAP